MAKGGSKSRSAGTEGQEIAGEYGRAVAAAEQAEARVLRIQTKLHQWAIR